jgi:serine/threonine-protein kinase ATR
MCTQPSLLNETCRFLLVSPAAFLSATLPRTLPQLFANCELKILEKVARDLSKNLSALFLGHSHEILAHVFLLQGPAQTNKALGFIIKILTDAADGPIEIQAIVRSYVFPLIAELVVLMGDENPDQAEMVRKLLLTYVS